MIQTPVAARLTDLHAFSPTCPDARDVKDFMARLGFDLELSLPAYRGTQNTKPLPPQYHFKDGSGTEVIFLAGRDNDEECRWMPHAARFWIYPGNSHAAYERTVKALRMQWGLPWKAA